MAMASKKDALATFLTESQALTEKKAGPSADEGSGLAGKVVILTILSKQPEPMAPEQLRIRCELSRSEFDRVVGYLIQKSWVETRDNGLCLTDAGSKAAEHERQRLLRFG